MKRLAGKPATVMLGSQLSCASVRNGVEVDAGSGGYQHQQEGCKEAAEKRAAMRLPCRVPVIRHVLSSPAYCIFR